MDNDHWCADILMTCQNAAAQILFSTFLGTKKKGHATTVLASLV